MKYNWYQIWFIVRYIVRTVWVLNSLVDGDINGPWNSGNVSRIEILL